MSDDQFTELKQYLDGCFAEQDAKFDDRFAAQDTKLEKHLEKRFKEQDADLKEWLNLQLAGFMGQLTRTFNERFDKLEKKLDSKADAEHVYRALDNIAKRLDDDAVERGAAQNQLDRHER